MDWKLHALPLAAVRRCLCAHTAHNPKSGAGRLWHMSLRATAPCAQAQDELASLAAAPLPPLPQMLIRGLPF